MEFRMKTIGSLLILILLIVLGLLLGTAVILAWSLGLGWLLMQIVPLTWFESALLTMLASIIMAFVGWRLLQMVPPSLGTELGDNSLLFETSIPVQRFKESEHDQRAEVWFRHAIANELYWEFDETPSISDSMSETEIKELAIRITDMVVALLQARTSKAQRVKITRTQLKQHMEKIGQRPYDDDILAAAARAVNQSLSFDERLADIVRDKRWNEIEIDW